MICIILPVALSTSRSFGWVLENGVFTEHGVFDRYHEVLYRCHVFDRYHEVFCHCHEVFDHCHEVFCRCREMFCRCHEVFYRCREVLVTIMRCYIAVMKCSVAIVKCSVTIMKCSVAVMKCSMAWSGCQPSCDRQTCDSYDTLHSDRTETVDWTDKSLDLCLDRQCWSGWCAVDFVIVTCSRCW